MAQPERRFAFVLAAALGCTVQELGSRMSAQEFAEWQCIFANEQLHPAVARHRHAQLLSAIYTGPATPPQGKRGHSAADFLGDDPWAAPPAPRKPPTIDELRAQIEMLNSRIGN